MLYVGAVVRIGARLRVEPGVEDLRELGLGGGAQAERQDVGVVPSARPLGGLRVEAQRGADPGDLVGRDRRPGAGPAAHDPLFGPAVGDVAGGDLAGPGPVVALRVAERAVDDRLVAALTQL